MGTDAAADRMAAHRAAERIQERRVKVGASGLEQMLDDLASIAWHPAQHSRGLPRELLADDFADAWALAEFMRRDLDRLRRALLLMARDRAGLTYRQIAEVIGLSSRQAVEALLRRLDSAVAGGTKSERPARADRKHARGVASLGGGRAEQIRAFIRLVLAHSDGIGDAGVGTDGLAAELEASGPVAAGTVAQLRLLVRELRDRREEQLSALARQGAQLLGGV